MGKIKQLNIGQKMSQEEFAAGIGGVCVPTPKQQLIKAVNEYKSLASKDFEDAKKELDIEGMASARCTISDCNHFLKLIEEIIPNE